MWEGFVALAQNIWVILGVAVAICGVAWLCYQHCFSEATTELLKRLANLRSALQGAVDPARGADRLAAARQAAAGHEAVTEAWNETERRLVALPREQGELAVLFGVPRDIWTPGRLLAGRVNLGLMESMPNLLVGVGLLFTFFFLTLALTEATAALAGPADNQVPLLEATRGLLGSASGKFLTSLAGLFASMVWTVTFRRRMEAVQRACDEVLQALVAVTPAECWRRSGSACIRW